jgi:23S rRNA (adenine2503-C2)-methyltransferase
MGCAFCESGRLKKVRNLESNEMVEQIIKIEEELNLRITHLVLMGIGEPFDNYDNVMNFIDIINENKGLGLGARHITISTCGLVPKIKEFARYDKQVNLAISLHAPNNEIRNQIMKINKAYPLEVLMDAIRYYESKANRRVTFEYIMLKGINDSDLCARQLASLLKGINSYVNLIPYNSVDEHLYKRSQREDIEKFANKLKKLGVNATIRKEFGSDIDAACGQLRAKNMKVLKGDK